MPGPAQAGGKRVHDAAMHADEAVLDLLAEPRPLGTREREAEQVFQPHEQGHLGGGRRAQPGADGHVAVEDALEAGRDEPPLLEQRHDASGIVPPRRAGARQGVECRIQPLVVVERVQDDAPVRPPPQRHVDGLPERHRQDEAVVVVGMIPDEVDPAGRTGQGRFGRRPDVPLEGPAHPFDGWEDRRTGLTGPCTGGGHDERPAW
ncbi:MAG: hypothetical protein KatS3mg015_2447 [Fimbriimonadales bacterium]|nr:MAG: hypothetical protein KatS3mg015_2447 [Fimbriimonadales bacterium]